MFKTDIKAKLLCPAFFTEILRQNPHQVVLGHKSFKSNALGRKKNSLSAIDDKVLTKGGIRISGRPTPQGLFYL